ncbi:unnamed protein product [Aureobasidium uvarum]|uniref:Uncharacterized protein n=1 Tax=Aureobasidium uvarum TaxID=2773716 RepID=A0A9N8PNN0_9PEZI|nr:unnamed protein product [Aureobasidium uvarum]
MTPAGSIALALFLTTFGVMFFWYIWVKAFEWELAIWYRHTVQHRQERELDLPSIDLERGRGEAGGGSEAASKAGSKKSGGEGSKTSGGGGSKHGSKAASNKSDNKNGGGSRHDSRSAGKA